MHGYEIGILAEEEARRFEEHLLECEHCYDELKSFQREASLLCGDTEIKALSADRPKEEVKPQSLANRIWRYLWPDVPIVFRPVLTYLVMAVLLPLAYQGLRRPDMIIVREFEQVIRLSSARAPAAVLTKSRSAEALLMFRCDGCRFGSTYRVAIESEDGSIIYSNDEFTGFDERHIGSLSLDMREMEPGEYRVTISSLPSDPASVSEEYPLLVEE